MASMRARSREHPSKEQPSEGHTAAQEISPPNWLHRRICKLPVLPVLAASLLLLTIALGTFYSFSIYSTDNPSLPIHQLTRLPPSSLASSQNVRPSTLPTSLPYFATKSNFFNQTFVKLGWAWTSLAIWAHLILLASHTVSHPQPSQSSEKLPEIRSARAQPNHVARSMALYSTATALWIFITQWFFGSSLIDRLLVLTGAQCVPSLAHGEGSEQLQTTPTNLPKAYCERRWGQRPAGLDSFIIATHKPYWNGGLDISGHIFLLSFSILLILSTLSPSLRLLSSSVKTSFRVGVYANLALVAIWWWMILMTSFYFHGPVEKAAGLIVGVGSWWISEFVVTKLMD